MDRDQTEIASIRKLLTSKPRPAGWAERRQRLDEAGAIWPVAEDVALAAVDPGGAPGEWSIVPGSDPSRVLMYLHGGGYCSGSILSHRRLIVEAGRAAGMRTLAVAYRLAPEHPFPAALDDVLRDWQFVRELGITASRIAVGGDSAGGGLTLALIRRLIELGEELPACAWVVSPWTDLCQVRRSWLRMQSTRSSTRAVSTSLPTLICRSASTGRTHQCHLSIQN